MKKKLAHYCINNERKLCLAFASTLSSVVLLLEKLSVCSLRFTKNSETVELVHASMEDRSPSKLNYA